MQVLYLICNVSHGIGGHFHSLQTVSYALKSQINYKVVILGLSDSKLFVDDCNSEFIYFNGFNFIKVLYKLIMFMKKHNIDVIHSYDERANTFGRILAVLFNIPLIHTKCGGKNNSKLPYNAYLILFSIENYNYYRNCKKFNKSILYYLPNRIGYIYDDQCCKNDILKLANGRKIIMMISRLDEYYKDSFFQAIRLTNRLNDSGIPSALFLIGVIESYKLLKMIKDLSNDLNNMYILNDSRYTLKASKCICASDIIVGSGRGIMEAASKGKILLAMVKGGGIPVLVTKDNFNRLFTNNFSPRNYLHDYNEEDNYIYIKKVLTDDAQRKNYQSYITNEYKNNFNVNAVISEYINLYNNARYKQYYNIPDFLINMIRTLIYVIKKCKTNSIFNKSKCF